MRRSSFGIALALALIALLHGRAMAITEYCPAVITVAPVGTSAQASVYGFELSALSPRTVSADVAFDTSAGWFSAHVPESQLSETSHYYAAPWGAFVRDLAVSPVMYVQFPKPVAVAHAFVTHASAQGDAFGWHNRGPVSCPPPGVPDPLAPQTPPNVHLVLQNPDSLSTPPTPESLIVQAKATPPLLSATSCAHPFAPVSILTQAKAAYPKSAAALDATGTAMVAVAVDTDGSVTDEWIESSSLYPQLDKSALAAAAASTYKPARAYCRNVQGIIEFPVTFNGGSS